MPLTSYIPAPILSLLRAVRNRRRCDRVVPVADAPEHCVLVMNGPSLEDSEQWLREKDDADFLAVNHFADHELFSELKPRHYVLQDSYFWLSDAIETYAEKRERTFRALSEKVSWPMVLFVPGHCRRREWLRDQIDNENICICHFQSDYLKSGDSIDQARLRPSRLMFHLWRTGWLAPPPENVLATALFLAERLGYRHLEVVGADFSFFTEMTVDQSTNVVGRHVKHFYGSELRPIFKEKSGKTPTTMAFEMARWSRAFQSIELVHEYLEQQGVTVLNRSGFSYIDSLPRPVGEE